MFFLYLNRKNDVYSAYGNLYSQINSEFHTLIKNQIQPDLSYSFAQVSVRQRYEQNPVLIAQYFIDDKRAKFILTT